jgi:hypothetical protein
MVLRPAGHLVTLCRGAGQPLQTRGPPAAGPGATGGAVRGPGPEGRGWSLFVASYVMSLEARGLGMRLRHIVRCTPGVRSASQPCQVYVQTSTMRVKRGRNSATAVLRRLPASCGISRRKCPAFDPGADVARAGRLCSPRRLAARTWRSLPSIAASPVKLQKWRYAVCTPCAGLVGASGSTLVPRWVGPEC